MAAREPLVLDFEDRESLKSALVTIAGRLNSMDEKLDGIQANQGRQDREIWDEHGKSRLDKIDDEVWDKKGESRLEQLAGRVQIQGMSIKGIWATIGVALTAAMAWFKHT